VGRTNLGWMDGVMRDAERLGVRNWSSNARIEIVGGDFLTHCGRVTQICVFNTVKLGTSASSP